MKTITLFSLSNVLLLTGAFAAPPEAQLLSRMPLRFEENRNASRASEAAYVAHGGKFDLALRPAESWLDTRGRRVRMALRGGNPNARMEPLDRLPGVSNYFLGSERNWKTDVVGYGRVRSVNVYPGIDLIFHGEGGRLEYDFVVAPQADPGSIRLEFSGQRSLHIDAGGDLILSTDAGEIRWNCPNIYQDVEGRHTPVAGHFIVSRNKVRFEIAHYDHGRELVIDPTLTYSTFLGGSSNDGARGIAVDGSGNVYISGNTTTTNLNTTPGVVQPNFGGETAMNQQGDAFVAKFSSSGALVYLTYLGGSGDDTATAIAVDAAGNAYITGSTTSANFPTAGTPYQSMFAGSGGDQILQFGDAFVAKLNPSGTQLVYSTYLGGTQDDFGTAIAIDSAGDAYVTGGTRSTDFPTTSGAYQNSLSGVGGQLIKTCCGLPLFDPGDAFVTELDPTGSHLIFSTYLGGSGDDVAFAIALDSTNNVYVGGFTLSRNFPTSPGAFQTKFAGSEPANEFFTFGDGFVAKLNSTGSALLYSTYFGGAGDDCVSAIAVDAAGNAYFTGSTSTENWATTTGAFQPAYGGYTELGFAEADPYVEQLIGDAFVAKLNASGTALVYMSYLGGSRNDGGTGIAVDSAGNAYVTGFADSTDFPITANALQPKMAGDGGQIQVTYYRYGDAFLTVVNPTGTALLYSSYFGGTYDDGALGLALDSRGTVHIAGVTISPNFPTTSNAAQKAYGGVKLFAGWAKGDAFLASFFLNTAPIPPTPTVTSVVDQAAGTSNLTPGMPIQVVGTGFGNSSTDSATVMIGTQAAPVLTFISSTNLIVQSPVDAPLGPTTLTVSYQGQTSTAFNIKLVALAPEIEPPQSQNGSSFYDATTNTPITAANPAVPGAQVYLLAIGLGTTNPAQITNTVATAQAPTTQQVQVTVGGKTLQPSYAGLFVGGTPGFYQVSFTVPAAMGNQPVTISVGGQTSNSQTLIAGSPIPVVNAIVNGATFKAGNNPQAANSFVSIFGQNFGSQNTDGNIFPAKSFQGLSVLVNGTAIPLYVVAGTGGQINVVLPSELGTSGSASVEVMTAQGTSAAFELPLAADSVGIFRIGDPSDPTRMNGAVLFTNTAWKVMPLSMAAALGLPSCATVTTASICGKPAMVGDQIEIYLTGLGKATPNGDPNGKVLPTGALAPADGSVLYKTVQTPTVKIGGVPATVEFSGIAPGNAGQYQINVQVPSGVQPGDNVTLQVTMPDGSTDTVTIAITAS